MKIGFFKRSLLSLLGLFEPTSEPARSGVEAWPVCWVRVGNDDLVAEVKIMVDGLMVKDPCSMAIENQQLLLGPYGLLSKERVFFISYGHITHFTQVSDVVEKLYYVTIKAIGDQAQAQFDGMLEESIEIVSGEFRSRPDQAMLDQLQEYLRSSGVDRLDDGEEMVRSTKDAIDDLVKLAESKGKGRSKSE